MPRPRRQHSMATQIVYPYLCRWHLTPPGDARQTDRFGHPCRIVSRVSSIAGGVLVHANTLQVLVEFRDGTRALVSRRAIRSRLTTVQPFARCRNNGPR